MARLCKDCVHFEPNPLLGNDYAYCDAVPSPIDGAPRYSCSTARARSTLCGEGAVWFASRTATLKPAELFPRDTTRKPVPHIKDLRAQANRLKAEPPDPGFRVGPFATLCLYLRGAFRAFKNWRGK